MIKSKVILGNLFKSGVLFVPLFFCKNTLNALVQSSTIHSWIQMTALCTESLKSNSKKDVHVSHTFSISRLSIKLPPWQDGKMGFLPVSLQDPAIPATPQLSSHLETGDNGWIQSWCFATHQSSCFLHLDNIVSTRWSCHRWRLDPGRAACKRWGCTGDRRQKAMVAEGTRPSWPQASLGWWREKEIYQFGTVREKIRKQAAKLSL